MAALPDDIWTQDLPNKKQQFDTFSYGVRLFRFVITLILTHVTPVYWHNLANTIWNGKTLFTKESI